MDEPHGWIPPGPGRSGLGRRPQRDDRIPLGGRRVRPATCHGRRPHQPQGCGHQCRRAGCRCPGGHGSNEDDPDRRDNIQQSEAAVRRLGLEMVAIKAGTDSEIENAVVAAVQQQANALSIANDACLSSRSRQIAFFALRHALATMSDSRETVAAGLLMSYGPNQADSFRQAGLYVGRILRGEKPADLPVLQPTKFELLINLTTAKAIGLKIPESFLLRADEVIE